VTLFHPYWLWLTSVLDFGWAWATTTTPGAAPCEATEASGASEAAASHAAAAAADAGGDEADDADDEKESPCPAGHAAGLAVSIWIVAGAAARFGN